MAKLVNSWHRSHKRPVFAASGALLLALAFSACVAPEAIDSESVGSSSLALVPGTPVAVTFSSEYNPKNSGWFTNNWEPNITYKLDAQATLYAANPDGAAITALNVYPGSQLQYIDGIGSSMEEATIYNLMKMSDTVRTGALKEMFTHDGWGNGKGINMSLARICLGTSDFTARTFYTYGSPASIQNDINYNIISVLQQAKGYSALLRFMGSPWSPPPAMKTSNNIIGGNLSSGQESALATYLRQAAKAYSDNGLKLWSMTMQNEPLFIPVDYPGMGMADWQGRDVAKALRTELNSNGQNDVKILAYDHNFSQAYPFMDSTANDSAAVAAIDGTAFHDYSGDPSMMTTIHNDSRLAGKSVHLSERTVWGVSGADRIVQYFRNWAQSYNAWVTMLDSNIQPEQWSGVPDPTMMIQSASSPNTYWRTAEYYIMGQFSKYVMPGARRIDSDAGSSGTVTDVAFLNPDGQVVMVVVNQTASSQTFKILSQGQQITATLPAKTVGTYRWQSDPSGSPTGLNTAFQAESGFQSGGLVSGTTVGYWEAGDYIAYRDINLSGAASLDMQVASNNSGGVVEVHMDSPTGTLLGSLTMTATGGWSTYANRNVPFTTTASGVHGLFIVAKPGAAGGVMNSDYFTLRGGANGIGIKVEAERGSLSGVQIENNGTTVGFYDAGDYMAFPGINLTGVTGMNLRIAGANSGGVVEFRIDSPTGTLLGTYTMTSTGGWTTWADRTMSFTTTTSGTHTLYVKGGSGGGIMNSDYFTTK
jgi:glucosylceramidase